MTPQELKNSILQLAIQGKLVEQRPEEGTVKEWYSQNCISQKTSERETPEIKEEDKKFDIPESWEWFRIGTLCNIINGFTPLRSNEAYWADPTIPWFTIDDIHLQGRIIFKTKQAINRCALAANSDRVLPPETVLLCCTASVGEYALSKIPLVTNQQFNGLVIKDSYTALLSPLFLFNILPAFKKDLLDLAGKTTFNYVSVKKLSNLVIPVPPRREQTRIVAKIEELLPFIDRYEQAWSRLETFNKRFPEDMKKSILQLAIQGKLVEQRPEEGTAEELYQQIQAKKQQLVKAGKLKKERPILEITENEKPFELPENWKWARLNDVVLMIGDIDHKMPESVENNGVPYISPLNFTANNGIDFDRAKQISEEDFESLGKKCVPERGDIIFPRYGTIGVVRLVKTDRKFIVSYSCCTIKNCGELMNPQYVYYVLQSNSIQNEINRYVNKTTQPNVGLQSIKRFLFPLPPLAEQMRIVAKLEELLPLCDKLK